MESFVICCDVNRSGGKLLNIVQSLSKCTVRKCPDSRFYSVDKERFMLLYTPEQRYQLFCEHYPDLAYKPIISPSKGLVIK